MFLGSVEPSGTQRLRWRLAELFNQCCLQSKLSREWRVAHIVSIFKKGNRNDPACYRGLSINSSVSRLFGKVLQGRLRDSIGDKISEDQSGFTPGKSCTDNLFVLQQVMEKKIAVDQEVHLAFIDLEKAYDSIPRSKIWEVLNILEVDRPLLKIIKELYKENESYVKIGHRLSNPINTTKGLRQGCSLSPLIFNAYVEVALREWKTKCQGMGIPIGDNTLFTLSFADDQVVIAQDSYDLEFMTKRLYQEYNKWGLQVSLKKTEYLAVNSNACFEVFINDNVQIQQVDKFKYLGATINNEGLGKEEIQTRIQKSKQVIGCLNSLWWDRNLSATTKKRLGRTLVESVLCYGSELWTLSADAKRKIQVVEMDYLRRSAGISRMEKKTNIEVRRIMNASEETVLDRIEKSSLKWFGHVLRMPENRWPKRVFQWAPQGRRKRGRPRKSWNGTVTEAMEARNLEADDALNRDVWRRVTGRQQ